MFSLDPCCNSQSILASLYSTASSPSSFKSLDLSLIYGAQQQYRLIYCAQVIHLFSFSYLCSRFPTNINLIMVWVFTVRVWFSSILVECCYTTCYKNTSSTSSSQICAFFVTQCKGLSSPPFIPDHSSHSYWPSDCYRLSMVAH